MNRGDTTAAGEAEARCRSCGRMLPDGLWFARIQRNGRTLEFCRPRCVESFLSAEDANAEADENRYSEAGFMVEAG